MKWLNGGRLGFATLILSEDGRRLTTMYGIEINPRAVDDTALVIAAPELLARLEAATKGMIAERDCIYDSVTDSEGNVYDPIDGEDLAELDREIDINRALIAKATGPSVSDTGEKTDV